MLRVIVLALGIALAAVPATVIAQSNPTLSEAERGIRSGDVGPAVQLRIDALTIDAHVVGRTADVSVEILIASDRADPYEANLALDLPADAVVTGYALDVDGRLIPGQLLEQPKARNLYEDEVRAGIDPGLAEVSGNRFTTRIYPIDAAHPRRFRLTFVAPFDPATGLVLPLARAAAIGRIATTVVIDGYATAPVVRFAGMPLALDRDEAAWRGRASAQQGRVQGGLAISGGTLAGAMAVARHSAGEAFFTIGDGTAAPMAAPPRGERLRIYWDRSRSHRDDRVDLESEVLAALVERIAPAAIDLVTFSSDRPQAITLRTAAELRAALARTTYRGATSLAGLNALALPAAGGCVLVSDGHVTIDRGTGFAPACRLMVLTSAPGADGLRLGRIAQSTGGAVVRVAEGSVAQAVTALAQRRFGVVAVLDAAGRRLDTRLLPAAAGHWAIVGRMPQAGPVTVRLSDGTARTYTATGAAVAADAPGSLWAVQRVTELGDDPARHAAMVDAARRFHIAGPGMAFLVLERPDQYLRAGIAPPREFPAAWLKTYRDARQEDDRERAGARRERFADVLAEWRKRRLWWQTRFVSRNRAQQQKRAARAGQDGPSPPPSPVMSAPPPAPIATVSTPLPSVGVAAESAQDVVVTGARATVLPQERIATPRAIKVELGDLLAKRPYLAALNAAAPAARLAVLARQERENGTLPGFYLDTAEWFRLKGDAATADLLLLSALDLATTDDETRQIVAFRLERDASYDRAVELAEQLAAANAEFRPQPGRSLALALAARGRARGTAGRADLERAFALLTDVALNPASGDFDGIEVVALMEANALIPAIVRAGGTWSLDKRLVGLTDTDARIVIEWTADDADIDLWVDEPNGERVYYSDTLSSAGGQISNDMTDGYGPEEYAIRRAPAGAYQVRINGYDADRINPNGAGHVLIRLIRNFARPGMRETMVDADLSFQAGRNRDAVAKAKPIATLVVAR